MVQTAHEKPAVTPELIVQEYQRAYRQLHKREAHVIHLTAEWYQVNGEMVHRLVLMREIGRLRELTQQQRMAATDRGMIQKLIARLRGM